MALNFYAKVAKRLKLDFRKFGGLISTFVENIGEKLVWGTFCPLPLPVNKREITISFVLTWVLTMLYAGKTVFHSI